MSDRIRHLEDALRLLQSTVSREPHPLLAKSLLQVKSIIELHGAFGGEPETLQPEKPEAEVDAESQYIDAFGTMGIRDDGATTFYGRSAGSEVSDNCSSHPVALVLISVPEPSDDSKLIALREETRPIIYIPHRERSPRRPHKICNHPGNRSFLDISANTPHPFLSLLHPLMALISIIWCRTTCHPGKMRGT
jgi:hypothetical protein